MSLALTKEKMEKIILKCQNLLSHPHTSSASSSTAKVFTATTNTITKSGLFIPGRDSIKQYVFKIKQWKITKAKGTKYSDTSRCIKIRLGSFLQQGVNWRVY